VWRKIVMANEIVRFGNMMIIIILIIKSELIIKCVIGFGRFLKNLKDHGDGKNGRFFSMFNKIRLYVGLKIYF